MSDKYRQILYVIGVALLLMSPHVVYLHYHHSEWWTIGLSMIASFCFAYLLSAIRTPLVRVLLLSFIQVAVCFEFTTLLAYRNYLNPCDIAAFFTFNNLESSSLLLYIIRFKLLPYVTLFILYFALCIASFFVKQLQCSKFYLSVCATVLLAGGIIACCISYPFSPYNIFKESWNALHMHLQNKYYTNQQPVQYAISANTAKGIYVLAIGESLRYGNWGMNGEYKRSTTPQMDRIGNKVSYTDCYSVSTFTQLSVPLILTSATPRTFKNNYTAPSIMSIYKQAGYKTYVISHAGQIMGYKEHDYLLRNVDSVLFISSDREVVNTLHSILTQKEEAFVLLHFLGNHFLYSNYPECYNEWLPNYTYHPEEHDDSIFINAYDNSILYTDSLLAACVEILREEERCSALFFTSDHGEFIDANSGGHGFSYHPTKDEYHVPLVIWYSDEYVKVHPKKVSNLIYHKAEPVCADHVFWSVLDMANIRMDGTLQQSGMSIFGDTLLPHKRTLLLPNGKSVVELD